jgi:hypothetical protein
MSERHSSLSCVARREVGAQPLNLGRCPLSVHCGSGPIGLVIRECRE